MKRYKGSFFITIPVTANTIQVLACRSIQQITGSKLSPVLLLCDRLQVDKWVVGLTFSGQVFTELYRNGGLVRHPY